MVCGIIGLCLPERLIKVDLFLFIEFNKNILILLEFAVNLRYSFFDPPAGGENQALLIFQNHPLELRVVVI